MLQCGIYLWFCTLTSHGSYYSLFLHSSHDCAINITNVAMWSLSMVLHRFCNLYAKFIILQCFRFGSLLVIWHCVGMVIYMHHIKPLEIQCIGLPSGLIFLLFQVTFFSYLLLIVGYLVTVLPHTVWVG